MIKEFLEQKRLESQMDKKTLEIAKALEVLLDNELITFDEARNITVNL
jgi:hypothetical protein|tara:strand:- start:48 stop:191 length:144 start_codon:yes stop_codon:yes gene_type:complete